MASAEVRGSAVISPCGRYRYMLSRHWGVRPHAWFVMLNPSTADAEVDDPTITRCMGFARAWGCGGVNVVNLYAWRATVPSDMFRAEIDGLDIVGPENDDYLLACRLASAQDQTPVIAAWGRNGRSERVDAVLELLGPGLQSLGRNGDGSPKHPLYLKGGTRPVPHPEPPDPAGPPIDFGWLSLPFAY